MSVPEQYHAIKADYLEHCRKIGNRPITLKTKERLLYLFLTYLDENNCKSLEYINSSEIIQFSVNLKNKEFYPELRDFLRYLFAQGYIEKDFSTLVPKFNRGIRIPETYDISEIIENRKCCRPNFFYRKTRLCDIASRFAIGMRAGDIASLKLDSLDFKNQRICFIQNKTGSVSRTLHGARNQNSTDGLSVNRSSCIHKRLCIFKIMCPLFRNIVFCCLICCKKTYDSLWY